MPVKGYIASLPGETIENNEYNHKVASLQELIILRKELNSIGCYFSK
jgi:hypothetical protein